MENRPVTLDCPVCGSMHAGLTATPARDTLWPYRVECPATCIQIPARFDSRGEVVIERESVNANGKAARDGRRVATSTLRSR
jgi:hypothetical protein